MSLTTYQTLRLSNSVRQEWYELMANLVGDGKPVHSILTELSAECIRTNHPLKPVVSQLLLRMSGGGDRSDLPTDSQALGALLRGMVPANEALLIQAGQESGNLAGGFAQAAVYVREIGQIIAAARSALINPTILFLMVIGFLLMYSFMILPALGTVVPRHLWPSYAKIYGSLADNAIPFAVGAISFMVGIGYAYMQTTRRWKSDWRDTFDRSVWPFTLTAGLNSSAMLIALAGFVGAGKPFADALIVLAEGADPYMKSIYKRLHDDIRSGSTPEVALSKSPVVSSKYHWLIRLYGKGSGFSDALANISSRVSESVKKQTNAASAFAGFFMKVFVVLFMIWTLATMMGILGGAKTAVH